ncbi:hypothetical protein DPMN_145513 [Dreissena polymorpha]|uniref:Uncharacterized protein n=1 Tax=Dreissena polymorpha TaxID=45954 RepID=A0A9D4F462_DREPO|nr:hypothetical protein DPMN_145513 [Dreissena polymorpha]
MRAAIRNDQINKHEKQYNNIRGQTITELHGHRTQPSADSCGENEGIRITGYRKGMDWASHVTSTHDPVSNSVEFHEDKTRDVASRMFTRQNVDDERRKTDKGYSEKLTMSTTVVKSSNWEFGVLL